jgi:DNA mismatch repair protein MutS2
MRLGMPDDIMKRARASLSDREADVARFLAELHRRLEEAQNRETELKEQQAALAVREKQIAHEWEKRESAKIKELEQRCDLLLDRFETQARETIDKIAESGDRRKATEQAQRKVAKAKRELREEFETTVLSTQDDARQGELHAHRPKIEEGVRVRLKGIREPARVRRKLGEDRIEVEAGFMKMQVPIDDVLEVLPEAAAAASKLPANVSFRSAPQLNPGFQEVNVIGEHAEEACDRVEKFLDSAVMATAARVRIVHGHGMGILKKAIWQLLAGNPHVEKYYAAAQNEGGAGATIVELKE